MNDNEAILVYMLLFGLFMRQKKNVMQTEYKKTDAVAINDEENSCLTDQIRLCPNVRRKINHSYELKIHTHTRTHTLVSSK